MMMNRRKILQQLDLYLLKVFDTLLNEQSVTRTAVLLETSQPAVSESLRRMRAITGDQLFVRSGHQMIPTDLAENLRAPVSQILDAAELSFLADRSFDPAHTDTTFRIAAPDYLDPLFIPNLIHTVRRTAPGARIDVRALTSDIDYVSQLANGAIDVAIGNWLEAAPSLHRGSLIDDEVVCLVAREHPAVRRGWSAKEWLASDHIAPPAMVAGSHGVIDDYLARRGLVRNVVAFCPHFSLMPRVVAGSNLVLTTGRQFCQRFMDDKVFALLPCPVKFPKLTYFQLWHQRGHRNPGKQWLRSQILAVAERLSQAAV